MQNSTDQELLLLFKNGNQNAFKQIVVRYEQQIRATIIGMIGSVVEVDDIAQDVFVRFYRSIIDFRGESKLSTYLTKIAINVSLNAIKSNKSRFDRRQNLKLIARDKTVNENTQFELRDTIASAVGKLNIDFRSVVVLRLIDGYSVRETAQILEIPEGTVASRLARAQKILQADLKNIYKNE